MTHLLKINRRSALRVALSVAFLSALAFSGCTLPEDDPGPPQGKLQVVHANPQEGLIDILLDDEVILSVAPGQLSEEVSLPQGEHVLSFRKAGAMSSYFSTEAITFGEQLNLLAISLNDEGDEEVLYLTDEAPMAEDGVHFVRVLDLSNRNQAVKMYRGLSEITTLPLEGDLSAFLSTEANSDPESYSLSDSETGAPLYQSPVQVTSPVGGASLVVVQPGGDDSDYLITVVSLR